MITERNRYTAGNLAVRLMRFTTNRKILAVGAFILLACLVVSLTPWYRSYVAADHEWLCAKYRALVEIKYRELASDNAAASESAETLVEQAIEMFYTRSEYTVSAADGGDDIYVIDGLCPAGGQYTTSYDEQGMLQVTCSEDGHDLFYTAYEE